MKDHRPGGLGVGAANNRFWIPSLAPSRGFKSGWTPTGNRRPISLLLPAHYRDAPAGRHRFRLPEALRFRRRDCLASIGRQTGGGRRGQCAASPDLARDRPIAPAARGDRESIASHHDQSLLLADLAKRFAQVVPFDFMNVVRHDPSSRDVMRLWLLVTSGAVHHRTGIETPVDESPGGLVWKTQEPLTVDDVEQGATVSRLDDPVSRERRAFVFVWCRSPLRTGVWARWDSEVCGPGSISRQRDRLHETGRAAKWRWRWTMRSTRRARWPIGHQLTRERDRQRLLLEVNNAVVSHLDLDQLFPAVSACLRRVIQHDGSSLLLCGMKKPAGGASMCWISIETKISLKGRIEETTQSPSCLAITTGKAALFNEQDLLAMGAPSPCAAGFAGSRHQVLLLRAASLAQSFDRRVECWTAAGRGFDPEDDTVAFGQVAQQIAIAVENALAFREIAALKDKLTKEKSISKKEIQTGYNFEEIVGKAAR